MMRRPLPLAAILLLVALPAHAQIVNPLTAIGKLVTTAADARTTAEVKDDVSIATDANKRLIDDKDAEWKGVSLLVFAQRVVIAGAVKSDAAKKRVAELVKQDKRIRSLVNELIVIKQAGDDGSMVGDKVIEEKINAALTTTTGVGSINMRWKAVNGHLVIMGAARSKEEAELAVKQARAVSGVKSLKSHLRVVAAK